MPERLQGFRRAFQEVVMRVPRGRKLMMIFNNGDNADDVCVRLDDAYVGDNDDDERAFFMANRLECFEVFLLSQMIIACFLLLLMIP